MVAGMKSSGGGGTRIARPPFGRTVKTILACIDFSGLERPVIDAGATLARAFGGELHLLHVADPDPAFVGYRAGPETVRDRVATTIREEHRRVEAILHEAERLSAQTIVIGAHTHGRLHALFVGSVAAQVLRGAKVPVLVVPQDALER
jgi:nucleotide-binding universal stress UspA family protein